ncbi:DASH family cryptochrome [Undibacterium flavidum]|uniref:Cryptochrome DASH n=1 Tax=Undibacterium flavidum TaxID=2762297 RepID=A0ABR6Y6L1_9BURK|nr:DASH family cryptochrome [Undibacterium flavidum]MBC3872213.1 DASH family cryptochrome [Undibacterium flavidum]
MKKLIIYWFRNDLRVDDNPALNHACALAERTGAALLTVFCHTFAYGTLGASQTKWGFVRCSAHRQEFLRDTIFDLRHQLNQYDIDLLELDGDLSAQTELWAYLWQYYELKMIVCEEIAAPEEMAQIKSLQALKLPVQSIWQSTMYESADFDFELTQMLDQFTTFRHKIEKGAYQIRQPALCVLSKSFALHDSNLHKFSAQVHVNLDDNFEHLVRDERSSFPYWTPAFRGGSQAASQHLQRYFSGDLAHHYKQTRNQLYGVDFSTKFSPWLASGALSAPQIIVALRQFEDAQGKSDSSYWIWFELLWRDYFRFLHIKYGAELYRASGLAKTPVTLPEFNEPQFQAWTQSQTGEPLVDAAMRELKCTGYLSNRLRQQVMSYWLHELSGDWRVAAVWFESQLLDYDVYSNQGNCLYLAGLGTDPRGYLGGRWFDPQKQAKQHDPDGTYRQLWSALECTLRIP